MDISGFFGVVSTVDFALLGLWWVSVQARPDLRGPRSKAGRAAYLVSLQFVVPGTAALFAQVDPQLVGIWRVTFAIAGLSGVVAIMLLSASLTADSARPVLRLLRLGAVPVYAIIAVIAVLPAFPPSGTRLTALQLESLFFCLMILLSAQIAWAVAMSGAQDAAPTPGATLDPDSGVSPASPIEWLPAGIRFIPNSGDPIGQECNPGSAVG